MNEEERLQILEMIEKGVISASEGVRLLNSIQGEPQEPALPSNSSTSTTAGQPGTVEEAEVVEEGLPPIDNTATPSANFETDVSRWRQWWWIPLTVGIGITVVSGLLMFVAYRSNGFGFWFACLWLPLLLGVILMSLAAASRTARWMHVRVHQAEGEHPRTIKISMPVPIRFVAWVMRTFKNRIPGMDRAGMDEAVLALGKITSDEPFYVKVDEGDSGEKVEVFIG